MRPHESIDCTTIERHHQAWQIGKTKEAIAAVLFYSRHGFSLVQAPRPTEFKVTSADIPLSNSPFPSLRALVVDDDVHICELIKLYAEDFDFETTTLSEPEHFAQIYKPDFHLISLDLDMPKVDGIEIIRYLGKTNCPAQIVLVSAAGKSILLAAQDLAINQNLSVLGVLEKPINPQKLTQMLQKSRERILSYASPAPEINVLISRGSNELPTLEELKAVIDDGQIDVFFQPKMQLPEQTFTGAEALARWNHPEKGFIPPDCFIPFAEEFGLMERLTEQILNRTCAYIAAWKDFPDDGQVSVNISDQSLGNLSFPDNLTQIVTNHGLRPSRFILEITESTLAANPTDALDVLTRLRLRGFDLSIDDFGTGHSSLARLRRIPFSELKIDKTFVGDSDTSAECRIIVKNTIDLARSLNINAVAEGAETQAHIDILSEFGCDKVQGYFFTKALPNEQFLEWKANWQSQEADRSDVRKDK